jgi:hypothetical protein
LSSNGNNSLSSHAGYGVNVLPQRYTNPKTGMSVTVPEEGLADLVLNLAE